MSSWFHSEFTAGFPPGPAGMFQRRSQQGLRVAQLGEAVQEVGYLAKHGNWPKKHLEVSQNGGYPYIWMVYFMEDPSYKWIMTGGTPVLGNHHVDFSAKNDVLLLQNERMGDLLKEIRFADSCDWNKIVKYWDSIGFKQQKSGTSWDILDFTWRNLIYVVTIKIADSSACKNIWIITWDWMWFHQR